MTAAASAAQVEPGDLSARQEFSRKLVKAAVARTQHVVRYDPAYVGIPYPGGDVPADTGPDFHAICAHYKLGRCRVFIKTG